MAARESLTAWWPVLLPLCMSILACSSGPPRPELPPPKQPLTLTPDALFRAHGPELELVVPPIEPLEVHRHVLDNGLTVLHVERPGIPKVVVEYVNHHAGTLSTHHSGAVATLTAEALVHGGTRMGNGEVLTNVRVNGIPVVVETDTDSSVLRLSAVTPAFDRSVEILARTVRKPVFAPDGVAAAQAELLDDLQTSFDSKRALAIEHVLTHMIGKRATNQLLGGNWRLSDMDPRDIPRAYNDIYRPETSAVVVVGAVSRADCIETVERHFGSWRPPGARRHAARKPVSLQPSRGGPRISLIHQGFAPQATVFMMLRGPNWYSDDVAAADISATVLGGLFDSRVNRALRHQEGVTYGVTSVFRPLRDLGLLRVAGSFQQTRTGEAIREMLSALRRLQRQTLSRDELQAAKVRVAAELGDFLSQVHGAAYAVERGFVYGTPEFLSRFQKLLARADAEHIRRVAARYFDPKQAHLVVYGDVSVIRPELPPSADVTVYTVE